MEDLGSGPDEGGDVRAGMPGMPLEGVSLRDLFGLRAMGFALARAWVYLMFVGSAVSVVTWDGAPVPGLAFAVSTACLFLTMFLSAFRSEELCRFMSRPHVRWGVPALIGLGTLAVVSSTLPGAPTLLLCVLGGAATGAGSGLLDLGFGEAYRNVDSRQTAFEAPFAFVLAAVVYFASWWLPPAGACLLACLMPLASAGILFGRLGVWSPASAPLARPVPISLARFAVRIGVCACLVGLADGMVRAVFMEAGGMVTRDLYRVPFLAASLVTVAIIWGSMLVLKAFDLRWIYKVTVGIMAFVFQLLPIFVGTGVQSVLVLAGYGTFNVLIWMLLADVASTYRLSAVTVFGIGWSMVTLGVFLGSLAGDAAVALFAPFSPRMLSIVALGATCAVLCSYMFVLKESDLVEMTSQAEKVEEVDEARAAAVPAAAVLAGKVEDRDGASRAGEVVAGERNKPKRFVSRCKEVAVQYGLTERETDVMIEYAKGHSYARLQKDMCLSRGTLTTHLRHIYQKMGVHGKQEFLDLIEGRRVDEERGGAGR